MSCFRLGFGELTICLMHKAIQLVRHAHSGVMAYCRPSFVVYDTNRYVFLPYCGRWSPSLCVRLCWDRQATSAQNVFEFFLVQMS